jgi:glutaminyl-peptide cyclotransferase
MTKKSILAYLLGIAFLLAFVLVWYGAAFLARSEPVTGEFNGQRAMEDVETQVAFGPRTPGSDGHAKTLAWMRSELMSAGWSIQIQQAEMLGHSIQNLIAFRDDENPRIILAAHYDTRLQADNDPDPGKRGDPVPGANDGASGVAVLLELARSLPKDTTSLWLVFFDAEDNGRIPGWDWILGSQAFVERLDFTPQAVIIVDMVADSDQDIYIEGNSDPNLVAEVWGAADELGYGDRFIPVTKYSILDDHTPFLEKGIPALDIIDFDYPYWHTIADTPDKLSADSLQAVGETLLTWVSRRSTDQ